jgi:hypothetical protein
MCAVKEDRDGRNGESTFIFFMEKPGAGVVLDSIDTGRKPVYVLRRAFRFGKSPHYIINFCESLFFLHKL